ncbi:hypothetical protein FZEAL_7668 [Fusarium zealandicum]|uniref:Uncharacterized protein n=1 Tax=Fusarium zealandicum TaxID=1053134 RepID=A0A8H4UG64_9HYPO|nr:hypothetical protein FZEAL_7668 [Fusarium zealandicum]
MAPQHYSYDHDAPGPSSSSWQRSSPREAERSSKGSSRDHRRRRSEKHSTKDDKRSKRRTERDEPAYNAGSSSQAGEQSERYDSIYRSYDPQLHAAGSSTSWASSSYASWDPASQPSEYDQDYLNDDRAQAASPATYGVEYETQDLSSRMGDMEINDTSYSQATYDEAGSYESYPYPEQQQEEASTEDPSAPQPKDRVSRKHRRHSSRR